MVLFKQFKIKLLGFFIFFITNLVFKIVKVIIMFNFKNVYGSVSIVFLIVIKINPKF